MKRNVIKNIKLDKREKIYREFRKLKAQGALVQMVLTTKRLIVYSKKKGNFRGRRVKFKSMNEIDINSIYRLEYYIVYIKNRLLVQILGCLLFIAGLAAGYFFYMGRIAIPASIPSNLLPYAKYVASGLISLIGLILLFNVKKILRFIVEAENSSTELEFEVNKYNEVAIRYIASKIRPN